MFKIENKKIGGKNPTFIIAEIGINHKGSLSLCKKLVIKAKKAGADAVKLQIVSPLYSYCKNTFSYKIFKKNNLTFENLLKIKKFCKKKKIILFGTPGDFKSLEMIKKLKFPAIKISSGLVNNYPLIAEAAKTKLPIIISTGMAYLNEIKDAIKTIKRNRNKKYAILKCTSLYPAPPSEINLKVIKNLISKFNNIPIGYSDHANNHDACLGAVSLGAKIIEKHITLDKNLKVPDQKVSIDPNEFKQMVKSIRNIESLLGNENIKPTKKEIKNRGIYHRSVMSVRDIKMGEILSLNNISLKRSKGNKLGLKPKDFFKAIGKKIKNKIKIDSVITKENTKI